MVERRVTVSYMQISFEAANRLVQAATEEAERRQVPVGVAVVDREGMLKAFARMDAAPAVAIDAPRAKARAALMGLGSEELGRALQDNLPNLLSVATMEDLTLLGGGLPIFHGGELIGALGVGGGTTEQDVAIAETALKALSS